MTTDAEAVVRRAYHVAEGSVMDVDGWANLYASDGIINLCHSGREFGGDGEVFTGSERIRYFLTHYAETFPDAHRELHRVYALGDMVAVELSIQGTFNGPFEAPQGIIEPNGAKVDIPTADFWYVRDGKIERFDCYIMISAMLAQMGLG
jgi:ketosteroid isomerase-like protein